MYSDMLLLSWQMIFHSRRGDPERQIEVAW